MGINKKISLGTAVLVIAIISVAVFYYLREKKNISQNAAIPVPVQTEIANPAPPADNSQAPNIPVGNQSASSFQPPLDRAGERVTKKPFGIYITPRTSPVQPEKFRGYHAGSDFEIFPEELNAEVPVRAVCSGKLLSKEYATGYGGVAVESCTLPASTRSPRFGEAGGDATSTRGGNNQPITVIYGHLKLASIAASAGQNISAGNTLGILGAAYSQETNGERKHLHLGFHKGISINILGYAQSQAELSDWIDPCWYVCHN